MSRYFLYLGFFQKVLRNIVSNHQNHRHLNLLFCFDKFYKLIQKLTIKWKYKYIIKFIKRGSLLDIGGGSGEFCNYLKKKKWDVSLQDFSNKARALSIQHNVKAYSSIDEIENKISQSESFSSIIENINVDVIDINEFVPNENTSTNAVSYTHLTLPTKA